MSKLLFIVQAILSLSAETLSMKVSCEVADDTIGATQKPCQITEPPTVADESAVALPGSKQ